MWHDLISYIVKQRKEIAQLPTTSTRERIHFILCDKDRMLYPNKYLIDDSCAIYARNLNLPDAVGRICQSLDALKLAIRDKRKNTIFMNINESNLKDINALLRYHGRAKPKKYLNSIVYEYYFWIEQTDEWMHPFLDSWEANENVQRISF